MNKTTEVRCRMTPKRKQAVSKILKRLGMTHSQAIDLFYAQIEMNKGIPFELRVPNETTQKAILDSREGKDIESYSSKEDLLKELKF